MNGRILGFADHNGVFGDDGVYQPSTFPTQQTVFIAAELYPQSKELAAGFTITVCWANPTGATIGDMWQQSISPPVPTVIPLPIMFEALPFAVAGRYECRVLVNGEVVATKAVSLSSQPPSTRLRS